MTTTETLHAKSTALLELLTERGGMKVGDIMQESGINKALVSYHLNQLKRKKLVTLDKSTHTWAAASAGPPAKKPSAKSAAPAATPTLPGIIEPRLGAHAGQGKGWAKGQIKAGTYAARILEYLRAADGEAITKNQVKSDLKMNESQFSSSVQRLRRLKLVTMGQRGSWKAVMDGVTPSAAPTKARKKYTKRTPHAELLPPAIAGQRETRPAQMRSVGPAGFTARQIQSIVLRMQNANDYAPFFTELDFQTIDKVMEAAR